MLAVHLLLAAAAACLPPASAALRPPPRAPLLAAVATLFAPPSTPLLHAACVTSTEGGIQAVQLGGGRTVVPVAPLFPGQAVACRLSRTLPPPGAPPPTATPRHRRHAPAPRPDIDTRCVVVAPGGDAGRGRGVRTARCAFNVTLAIVAPPSPRRTSAFSISSSGDDSTSSPPYVDVAADALHTLTLATGDAAAAATARADAAVPPTSGDSVPLPGQYMLAAMAAATAGVAVGAVGGLAGAHAADAVAYRRAGGRLLSRAGAEWMAGGQSGRRWR